MLFSDDVLFIHIPKTAGMSITKYLINNLPGPLTLAIPALDHEAVKAKNAVFPDVYDRLTIVPGRRHETIDEAATLLAAHGRSITEFRLILAVTRNPYDLEVSHYQHVQRPGIAASRGDSDNEVRLAKTGDFEAFVKGASFWGIPGSQIQRYYEYAKVAPRIRLIRFEYMGDDLEAALGGVSLGRFSLGHQNKTPNRRHWQEFITPSVEAEIYNKYRYLFNFYPRGDGSK